MGTAGLFSVTTSGRAGSTVTYTGALPSGVSFTDNGDGTATVAGTPTAAGSFRIVIKVSSGAAPGGTQAFTLTVTQAPAITSADHTTFAAGRPGRFTVRTAAGYPTSTTITETGALPPGVTFTDKGNGTATIAGTPTASGTFWITITAGNGSPPGDTQSFSLTVTEKPAVTSADHSTFTAGSAGSFTVTTAAGYPPPTTVTVTGTRPPGVSVTDNGDGTATLAGTPAPGTAGSYPLAITASTPTGSTRQAFTLTVDAGHPPTRRSLQAR